MTALSSALDKMKSLQFGENNNTEYTWSHSTEEMLIQFNFQLTRSSEIKYLEDKYQELLHKIFISSPSIKYIKILYKLIGYTRDIVAGKGEYNLTYMLISGLYKFSQSDSCPIEDKIKIQALATSAIDSLVRTNINEHPYGSWKDLKYFCNYHIAPHNRTEYKLKQLNDPLFNKIIDMICAQVRCDEKSPVKSLAAKWIPREKSKKFGWIAAPLATRYYAEWMPDGVNISHEKISVARKKCLTHFRQLVAKINRQLNTPQINQCEREWRNINFDKNVTSITLRKQSKAFQTKARSGKLRQELINNEDRQLCKQKYEQYINSCKTGKSIAKGNCVSIVDYVRDAIRLPQTDVTERCCINLQWNNNATHNNALCDLIAMVDTSASMESDNYLPLYSAVGLGIRIAEKSRLGKRLLTFSAKPQWINLEDCPTFVSMVKKVYKCDWGMNTNFIAALDLILDTAISNNIAPNEMNNMTLVILSDMQIDHCRQDSNTDTMFEMMEKKYYDAGLRTAYQKPYELPHIVFWNLRQTTGFPSLTTTKNTTMMSGNNPVLLNAFSEEGVESLKNITPWKMLNQHLANDRYTYLDNIVTNLWA